MKRLLGPLAATCLPVLVLVMVLAIKSRWSATQAVVRVGGQAYRTTVDEAGLYLAGFPIDRPWVAPAVPRTFGWSQRVRFSITGGQSGRAQAWLVHFPYWPFWIVVTPPVVGWLLRERRRRELLMRRCQNLCVRCAYDLRASAGRCPECGTPIQLAGESSVPARS